MSSHRVIGSSSLRTWGTMNPWDSSRQGQSQQIIQIQVTKTGRIITPNRQHIRPTHITAENLLCNQVNKHTKADPLDDTLDHIQRHPPPCTTKNLQMKGQTTILCQVYTKRQMVYKTLK